MEKLVSEKEVLKLGFKKIKPRVYENKGERFRYLICSQCRRFSIVIAQPDRNRKINWKCNWCPAEQSNDI